MTYQTVVHGPAWYVGLIAGAVLVGAVVGLIPLCMGLLMKQRKLAYAGLAACTMGGLIFGIKGAMWSAVPVVATIFGNWYRRRAEQSKRSGTAA
jgi:hypothetical protein